MTCKHNVAFVGYLLGKVMYFSALILYVEDENAKTLEIFFVVGILYSFLTLTAQIFLGIIFWDLGKKITYLRTESRERLSES